MAVSTKVLIAAKTAENAQTTQYTATNVTTIIDKFTATNYSGTAATISVNLVTASDRDWETAMFHLIKICNVLH